MAQEAQNAGDGEQAQHKKPGLYQKHKDKGKAAIGVGVILGAMWTFQVDTQKMVIENHKVILGKLEEIKEDARGDKLNYMTLLAETHEDVSVHDASDNLKFRMIGNKIGIDLSDK